EQSPDGPGALPNRGPFAAGRCVPARIAPVWADSRARAVAAAAARPSNGQGTHRTDSREAAMVITVTRSTGTIGSELVATLSRGGVPTRAILRNPGKARPLPHVVWAQ